jgi:hypothetical protein
MNKISEIKIKSLFDAEKVLKIIEDRKIPIIGTCACLFSIYTEQFNFELLPICKNEHIILIPERYKESATEILRTVEEDLPILY